MQSGPSGSFPLSNSMPSASLQPCAPLFASTSRVTLEHPLNASAMAPSRSSEGRPYPAHAFATMATALLQANGEALFPRRQTVLDWALGLQQHYMVSDDKLSESFHLFRLPRPQPHFAAEMPSRCSSSTPFGESQASTWPCCSFGSIGAKPIEYRLGRCWRLSPTSSSSR